MEETGKPHSIFQQGMMPKEEVLDREKRGKQMVLAILKESDPWETRIPLTPQGVEMLVQNGHRILVERGAGRGARFTDHDYTEAGGEGINNKQRLFEASIIMKISPLTAEEVAFMKQGKTLITSLQLATRDLAYFQELMRRKVTAVAFELIQDEAMEFPVLRSMCEIAGSVAVNIGAGLLTSEGEGKGILLGGITGITPSEVVILGAGTAGEFAARAALGLGTVVKVFDHSIPLLRSLKHHIGQEVFTSVLHPPVLRKALETADLVISTLQRMHRESFFLVPEEMIMGMKEGSIVIDIHIDQGSSFETGAITTPDQPVYTRHRVRHYMVPNMTSRVARTASIALSNVFLPILMNKGRCGGVHQLIMEDRGIRNGVYLYNGTLTNEWIASQFGISSQDIDLLLSAF